ncbi:MAG TPA: 50S ribosomal protein L37ae [archaeon]|nr:50S ribosomal protein L37ae [archaeon]HLD80464.1 50S ribosomal protein L37ae [archaeon]
MAVKLSKHRHAGSLGPRYGLKIRKLVHDIESVKRAPKPCPSCGFEKVKRLASGIYYCRKCEHKFAGGSFAPQTLVGQTVSRILRQGATQPVEKVEELLEKVQEAGKREAEAPAVEKPPAEKKKERKKKAKEEKAPEKEKAAEAVEEEELAEEELPLRERRKNTEE